MVHPLVERLATIATEKGIRICTAESCTGGWVAQEITEIAGSSEWFEAGFVTYSNEAKHTMLGVPETLFISDGAVSEPVVRAMAQGAIEHSRAQLSVSISGVAGPGGGSEEKPVGTVWMAWHLTGHETVAERFLFSGDRHQVRQQAVSKALEGLINQALKSTV
ncbi:MAG: CinA family protein [Amphritea sp.]|nr:CinA family protein [Amphritea sp.]